MSDFIELIDMDGKRTYSVNFIKSILPINYGVTLNVIEKTQIFSHDRDDDIFDLPYEDFMKKFREALASDEPVFTIEKD